MIRTLSAASTAFALVWGAVLLALAISGVVIAWTLTGQVGALKGDLTTKIEALNADLRTVTADVAGFKAQLRDIRELQDKQYFYSSEIEEIPLEAILGNKRIFVSWSSTFRKKYTSWLDGIGNMAPFAAKVDGEEKVDGITLLKVKFDFDAASPMQGKIAGGVLALPVRTDPRKPIVIAIHGHEHAEWGQLPIGLFRDRKWPYELAKAGFVVWAPVSMYHDEVSSIAANKGYALAWTKIASDGIVLMKRAQFKEVPHDSLVVAGLSSGAQIGYLLMAYRRDIVAGVFAGSEAPLEFTRKEYRVKGHPACNDISGVYSYSTIQSLIAPRPVQFQSGRKDPMWPNRQPLTPNAWFSGTARDVTSDEVGGELLIREKIWTMMGGRLSVHIHNGGHELDAVAAARFFQGTIRTRRAMK